MSNQLVLVTGISGFVATHVALEYLKNGHPVRGTVRSKEKGEVVKKTPCFQPYLEQLSFVVVEDLVTGDFSEAVKDVSIIAHTASPFHMSGSSWENDYRDPAVRGTRNCLEAAAKESSVKHVVVTSSFASVGDFSKPATEQAGKVYTEKDWNPITEKECEGLKSDNPMAASLWYCASKKFAEKTAWEIAEQSNFTLSTICPPMVFGPPLHNVDSLDALNTSSGAVYGLMKKDGSSSKEVPDTAFPAFADVRNVAEAHFKSSIEGKNERYLVCNGTFTNQTIVDSIRDRYPDLKDRLAEGNRGEKPDGKVFTLDASKAEKELGLRYISFEDCVKDTVDRFLAIEKDVN